MYDYHTIRFMNECRMAGVCANCGWIASLVSKASFTPLCDSCSLGIPDSLLIRAVYQ